MVLKRRKYTWAFYVWVVFITIMSLVSFPEDSKLNLRIPFLDKAVHFSFYFVVAILAVFYLREVSKKHLSLTAALASAFVFASLYGTIIEVIQGTLTRDRAMEFSDVIANCCGALFGVLFVRLMFYGDRKQKWKH